MVISSGLSAKALIDPTRPSVVSSQSQNKGKVSKPEFVLNAIVINGENKYAIINGKQYQQGQSIQGKKLILVSQNQVVLDSQDGKKTLFMNKYTIKKDVNNGF